MDTAIHHLAVYRAAHASFVFGLLSAVMFGVFYSTDRIPWLLVTHLLGVGAFALGVTALLHVPVISGKQRILAVTGMIVGAGHAAALGFLLSFAAGI